MSILYQYTVTRVDDTYKTMEVTYTADGFGPTIVSMPLPAGNQTAEDIIRSYSPVHQWEASLLPYVSVQVGLSGEVHPVITTNPNLTLSVGRYEF